MRAMPPSGTRIVPSVANRGLMVGRLRYRHPADPTRDDRTTSATFDRFSGKDMNMIRAILCTTALLASATCAHAHASDDSRHGSGITIDAKDGPERVVPRQRPASGKPRLLSTNQWSEMMLKDDTVYLQLTDYGMKQVMEPQDAHDKDEGFLGSVLKTMALSGVKQILDHGLALSLVDTRSALVRDGEVVFVTCKGQEVFNQVKINDQVQKYPQASAEDFVSNVNRVRATLPACRP
jgi:hypothetical protein